MTDDRKYIYELWKDEFISQLNKQIIDINEIQEKKGYLTTYIISVVCASVLFCLISITMRILGVVIHTSGHLFPIYFHNSIDSLTPSLSSNDAISEST